MSFKPSNNSNFVKNLKILLAEDNWVNQRLALALLDKLGYSADAVKTGKEVLNALEQKFYDVILMDVHMPEMCGITATQQIYQLYPTHNRPYIIALTAFSVKGDADKCLNAGMQEHLNKPIDAEALELMLQRLEHQFKNVEIPDAIASNQRVHSKLSSTRPLDPRFYDKYNQDTPIVDYQVIESIRKMAGIAAQTLIAQLIDSYLSETPAMLNRLYQAMETQDCVALYKAAHALRSSSANLGAAHLAQICAWVEEQGHLGTTLILRDYQPLLDDTYLLTKAELAAIR